MSPAVLAIVAVTASFVVALGLTLAVRLGLRPQPREQDEEGGGARREERLFSKTAQLALPMRGPRKTEPRPVAPKKTAGEG